jgi:hypothetical protein
VSLEFLQKLKLRIELLDFSFRGPNRVSIESAPDPKATSAQTLSRSDEASVITFLLLMEARLCYYTENKPIEETIGNFVGPIDR